MNKPNIAKIKARLCEKSPGDLMHYTCSIMAVFMVVVIIMYSFTMRRTTMCKTLLEDGLVAAALAGAVPDSNRFADSGDLCIPDPKVSFGQFKTAITANYNLQGNLNTVQSAFLSGPVDILQYTVYNVEGSAVSVSSIDPNSGGIASTTTGSIGAITTPNGKQVDATTIFVEIGVNVKAMQIKIFGINSEAATQYVKVAKAVSIVQA